MNAQKQDESPGRDRYINEKDGKGQDEAGIRNRRRPIERDDGAASMRKAK
jgi:hypothetical protein